MLLIIILNQGMYKNTVTENLLKFPPFLSYQQGNSAENRVQKIQKMCKYMLF